MGRTSGQAILVHQSNRHDSVAVGGLLCDDPVSECLTMGIQLEPHVPTTVYIRMDCS